MKSGNVLKQMGLLLGLISSLLAAGCASTYAGEGGKPQVTLDNGQFVVTIRGMGAGGPDYWMVIIAENTTQNELMFDPGDIEIENLDTGIMHYSVTKGKSEVSLGRGYQTPLMPITVPAERKITGWIYFMTGGAAIGNSIKVSYGKASVILKR